MGSQRRRTGKSIPGKGNSICTAYVADESGLTQGLKKNASMVRDLKARVRVLRDGAGAGVCGGQAGDGQE